MAQTTLYTLAAPDVLTQQAASEGGGLHWTLPDNGSGTFDAINRGDLIIYGELIGVALTDFNLTTDMVAIDVFGAWYLPVVADVEIGDWIYAHIDIAGVVTLNVTPDDGTPIGQAMATDSSYSSTAIAVPVKLWPTCNSQVWDEDDLASTVTYRMGLTRLKEGDITASVATHNIGFAHGAGTVVKAGFSLGNTGTDASNPLSMEVDVTIGGTTVFTTKPVIDKTAADGASSFVAGTGVTVGALNAAAVAVGANDPIAALATLTRTASPSDEMADLCVYVEIEYKVGA